MDRIPDQYPLGAPQVVLSQNMSTSSGSLTVPLTFQASHDAFGIYLTPATSGTSGGFPSSYHQLVIGNDNLCLDVFGNTTAAGAAIDQWTCNGQRAGHQPGLHTTLTVVAAASGWPADGRPARRPIPSQGVDPPHA